MISQPDDEHPDPYRLEYKDLKNQIKFLGTRGLRFSDNEVTLVTTSLRARLAPAGIYVKPVWGEKTSKLGGEEVFLLCRVLHSFGVRLRHRCTSLSLHSLTPENKTPDAVNSRPVFFFAKESIAETACKTHD